MPANEHPYFNQPEDISSTIWRYMAFSKYVSMLNSGGLHFVNCRHFEDPFEGTLPKNNVKSMDGGRTASGNSPDAAKWKSNLAKRTTSHLSLNCWHMNIGESMGVWSLYASLDQSVAIKSIYSSLKHVLPSSPNNLPDSLIYLGSVKYIDYEQETINDENMFAPISHKRSAFEHEREVRAVLWDRGGMVRGQAIEHLNVQVNLRELIQSVVVSPKASDWFYRLVCDVTSKYGYNFNITKSLLANPPNY